MGKKSKYSNKFELAEYWVDAHCHLCNEPLSDHYLEEIEGALQNEVSYFISTALNRKAIDWHLNNPHPNYHLVAGIHPFYDKSNFNDFEYIAQLCKRGLLWGIGEVGFDNRKNNHNHQKNILYPQLELASQYNLPVVFHVVRRYNELYLALKNDFPDIRGYIHGFNGSLEIVEMFSRLNIGFSIGYKLFQKKDVPQIIERILDNGLVLLETDAPFQHNPFDRYNSNGALSGITSIAEEVTKICNYSYDELLEKQWQTYQIMNG